MTIMRNFRLVAAVAVIGLIGYAMLSERVAAADPRCGLGPPPGTPAFTEEQRRQEQEVERQGYLSVCEANLERYDITPQLKPLAEVSAGLAFQPVDLAQTPFATFESLGGMQETVGDVRSRFYRSFRTANGRTLTLFEHDMSADGVQMYRDPKLEPERINGLPARLVVLQAGKRAVSVLSWTEGRRAYELWLDVNVVLEHQRQPFFDLAAALPKSIPARPNEPQRPPMKIGPDGMPIIEMPRTLPANGH
jgi:hypothetical protein